MQEKDSQIENQNNDFTNNSLTDNEVKNDDEIKDSKKAKKGLASFLKGKKFTYTLPGKKQINIFGSIVLGLNLILILLVILYLKNQEFHDFVFNFGR